MILFLLCFWTVDSVSVGLPQWLSGKESICSAEDAGNVGSHPWVRKIPWLPWEGHGNPLQYSCLDKPMDRGAWWASVHSVSKSRTWLSNWTTKATLTIRRVGKKTKIKTVDHYLEKNETPIPVLLDAKIRAHCIPWNAFETGSSLKLMTKKLVSC